ncbi:MAG: beta-lactamase family protein [Ignavibacteriales bacterium]|nr:beta-lactamase family protein [Ignavibacteriales bacterium]MCB9258463.1 beta-lactamase family protein [Ignavibacteriales bacterium]
MSYKILFAIFSLFLIIALFVDVSEKNDNTETVVLEDTVKIKIDKKQIAKSKELHEYFKRRHEKIGFNGAVLFAENGKVVYKNAFGFADIKNKKKINLKTRFQIASVSKPFTTYAIMLLKQAGELDYNDDVRKYFPEFPYENITIRLLMIHKSGLPEYFYFADKLWEDRFKPISNKEVIELMIKHHPQRYYLPDKKYNYINTNYCLLAAIVEEISDMPFEEFMQEEVFEPLEMENTFIYNKKKPTEEDNCAIGYSRRRRIAEDSYLNGVVGDKGIYTTVEDMLKFDQALYNGEPLHSEILSEAFQPAHKKLYIHDNYGFGWRINAQDSTNKIVYHTGWWKGFRSYFIRELGKKKTIIVLSNMSNQSVFGTKQLIELF